MKFITRLPVIGWLWSFLTKNRETGHSLVRADSSQYGAKPPIVYETKDVERARKHVLMQFRPRISDELESEQ